MFVKYTPKHPHIKVVPIVNGDGLSVTAESVTLNPGTNEVSDEKWEKIKSSLASEIAEGTVKPFSVTTKKQGQNAVARSLKDVPAKVAVKIVAGCSSKDTLRTWFRETLPDEIALAVVRRMRLLNMDLDEIAEGTDELSDDDITDESKVHEPASSGNDGAGSGDAGDTGYPSFDDMGYRELQAAAKEKGINPAQKKEELIAALKGGGGEPPVVSGDDTGNGAAGSGDGIPDFDDPNAKVS